MGFHAGSTERPDGAFLACVDILTAGARPVAQFAALYLRMAIDRSPWRYASFNAWIANYPFRNP